MTQLLRELLGVPAVRRHPHTRARLASWRVPEPPLGFVRRSDPNFYFLARKF